MPYNSLYSQKTPYRTKGVGVQCKQTLCCIFFYYVPISIYESSLSWRRLQCLKASALYKIGRMQRLSPLCSLGHKALWAPRLGGHSSTPGAQGKADGQSFWSPLTEVRHEIHILLLPRRARKTLTAGVHAARFFVVSTLSDSGLKTMPRVPPNLYGTVTVRQILSQTVEVSVINKSQRVRSSVCLYRWLVMVRQGNSRFLASYSEMK